MRMWKKKTAARWGAIAAALMLLTGCGGDPAVNDEVRLGYVGGAQTVDPALAATAQERAMASALFEGLYTYSADGELTPGQAERCVIDEDGLRYTFYLREGLTWSDGGPVTAQQFADSWTRAVELGTPQASAFSVIDGYYGDALRVEAPDERTLVVWLTHETPDFLARTARTAFFPVQPEAAARDHWATSARSCVSNGRYRLEQVSDRGWLLTWRKEYWEQGSGRGRPLLFVPFEDAGEAAGAFEQGQVDFAAPLGEREAGGWRQYAELHRYPGSAGYYLKSDWLTGYACAPDGTDWFYTIFMETS